MTSEEIKKLILQNKELMKKAVKSEKESRDLYQGYMSLDEKNRATIEDLREKSDALAKYKETVGLQDKVMQNKAAIYSKFKQQAVGTVRAMRNEKAAALEERENALRLNDDLLNNREQNDEAVRLREALKTLSQKETWQSEEHKRRR